MWPIILSDRLPIVGLVGRYSANYLMGRRLLLWQPFGLWQQNHAISLHYLELALISQCYASP